MDITTKLQTVNRTVIDTYFTGLRLPLTAVERVTGNTETAAWPPAVAFESFEAGARKVLGSILRDEDLVEQGRLQQAKLQELAEAERLETKAQMTREAADAELAQKQEAAARQREQAEKQAEQREAALEREKAAKRKQADQAAAKRKQVVASTEELRERVLTAQERAAKRTRIAAETEALTEKSKALGAAEKAHVLDNALEAKRAQRKGA